MIGIESNFAWSALAATVMGLQCQLAGMACAAARKKYGVDYPDMGSGRYSAKLSDEQWKEFNNILRVHYNYVEQLPIVISSVLIAGLFFPTFAPTVGAIYIIGRQLYSSGYKAYGPKGRMVGGITLNLSNFVLIGTCFYGIYKTLAA